jgi:Ricin-type beta-trefoil lectin domain
LRALSGHRSRTAAALVPLLALAMMTFGAAPALAARAAVRPAAAGTPPQQPKRPHAVPATKGALSSAAPNGFSPSALRSAYNLARSSTHDGRGRTVAIVAAYSDPDASADLAVYRKHFRLPACTQANRCLRIINEHGSTRGLPAANSSWATGEAESLDVISALCPNCHLVLVEAASNAFQNLATAENAATAAGARFVYTGWYAPEWPGLDAYDHFFNHPGVAIVAPSGGSSYDPTYPGDLPYVTSVGGTTLSRSKSGRRGWDETAWSDSGSGCSALEAKPAWQRADASPSTGCMTRTQNDVAADADPVTGAAVYDSYSTTTPWTEQGGTGLAASIVTAVYALAGTPARDTYPASYPYQHARDLNDVTSGANGVCPPGRPYLCTAQRGYDGPTGLGTPDGTTAFSAAGTDPVTVMDPGTQDDEAGTGISVTVPGLNSVKGDHLKYTATGLPPGLSIRPLRSSMNAEITGKLPAAARTYTLTVTATDTRHRKRGSARFWLVAATSLTPASPTTTSIGTEPSLPTDQALLECLDAGAGTAGTDVTVQKCGGTAEQMWTYLPEGAPGAPDQITHDGLCLGLGGGTVQLATCNRGIATQGWRRLYGALLQDAGSGSCLQTDATFASPLTLQACSTGDFYQQWYLTTASLESAVPGMCLGTGSVSSIEPCGQSGTAQNYIFESDGVILSDDGSVCLTGGYGGVDSLEGILCGGSDTYDLWLPLANGEIANQVTGECLDDSGNSAVAGTPLQLAPCDGSIGEIWAII